MKKKKKRERKKKRKNDVSDTAKLDKVAREEYITYGAMAECPRLINMSDPN